MKIVDSKHTIWAERYRPQCLDDLIMPEAIKSRIREWIQDKEIPHIGVFGNTPGTGKTSLMNVFIHELDTETLRINGSKDNGIDDMRYTIGGFANSMSITGSKKLVCIDEADYLTNAAQSTLRTDLEVYSKNTRFVFTGNYPDKLIPPLLDRLQIFNLDDIYTHNKKELGAQIYSRLKFILENENVTFKQPDVLEVVKKFYPSTRSMVMFIQQNTTNNILDFEAIKTTDDVFMEIVESMKLRKFTAIKTLVDDVLVPDNSYTYFWKNLNEIFPSESQPPVIMLLAEYQDFSQKAKNKYIPLMAMLIKIISDPDIKFK
ncbi:MAG: AAA family ATPase [Bacteroidales bacterium]|nr:AAA family ATPase [Bacteroidales bacterium]